MKGHKWYSLMLFGLLLLMVLLAAGGCGTDDSEDAGVIERDPLVVLQSAEPPTLDWQFHESGYASNVYSCIFDQLVWFDRDMNIVGKLAKSWEVSDDGKTWTLELEQGVEFHNGEPFNAESVEFTLMRALDPDMLEAKIFDPFPDRAQLDFVEVIDEYTVAIHTKEPVSQFLVFLSFQRMLPPKYYSETPLDELAVKPVGSGPWEFVEWEKDSHIILKAFDNYWRGKPEIDTVIWKPVPDGSARLAMLETGEADIMTGLGPEDLGIIEAHPDLRVGTSPGGFRIFMGIPCGHVPEYRDNRVRQAFNYAVDWDAINESLLAGLSDGRLITPVIGEFWKHPDLEPYPYDPDKALELLTEANFPMDREITIYTPRGRQVKDEEISTTVASYLRDLGLDVQVQSIEWGVYYPMFQEDKLDDLFYFGLGSRHYGPEDVTQLSKHNFFDKTGWTEYAERGDEFESLLEEMQSVMDPNEQLELLYQIQEIIVEEAPWINLWLQTEVFAINNRVEWEPSGNYRIELWLPGEPGPKWVD